MSLFFFLGTPSWWKLAGRAPWWRPCGWAPPNTRGWACGSSSGRCCGSRSRHVRGSCCQGVRSGGASGVRRHFLLFENLFIYIYLHIYIHNICTVVESWAVRQRKKIFFHEMFFNFFKHWNIFFLETFFMLSGCPQWWSLDGETLEEL